MLAQHKRSGGALLGGPLMLIVLLFCVLPGCAAVQSPQATEAPAANTEAAPSAAVPTEEPLPRYADHEPSMEQPAGPLLISEVTLADGDSVELKNCSAQTLRLSDYYLSDKNRTRLKLRLPDVELAPGELFVSDALSLSVKGERLWLSDGEENVLDYANISGVPAGGSYGRLDGRDGWFYFPVSSIGEDNGEGFRRVSEQPVASLPSGAFDEVGDGLSLELSGSGAIYYTLDGQKPDAEAELYTGPLHLTKTTVVRAYCVEPDALPSRVATFNYFINEYHTLPILAFSADNYGAWRNHYYGGSRDGEFEGTAALYRDGKELFNQNCGLRLKGWSAVQDEMKKNVGLYFRGKYGDGNLENCELFGDGISAYSSLLIRAGQDHQRALMRNEIMQELCLEGSKVLPAQHNLYCVLYMNGQYMGIHSLKENMNEHFFADLYGVSPESITTLRVRTDVQACEPLQEIFALGENADMSDPDNYARFCERFDIDNYIDFILFEGFSGNTDLQENVRYFYSPEIDQRWRFAFFDLDRAFYSYYGGMRVVFESYAKASHEVTFISRNLIHNPEFRDKLLSRYAELLSGPLSPENVTATIRRLEAELAPEIDRDRSRHGIGETYWYYMMETLYPYGSIDYTRATIDALRHDLEMSDEEVARYFSPWLDEAEHG